MKYGQAREGVSDDGSADSNRIFMLAYFLAFLFMFSGR
jgi:hypothetical protein